SCMLLFIVTTLPHPTPIYTLSLHDALPIFDPGLRGPGARAEPGLPAQARPGRGTGIDQQPRIPELPRGPVRCGASGDADALQLRSEEHTSELQSPDHVVCERLLVDKTPA